MLERGPLFYAALALSLGLAALILAPLAVVGVEAVHPLGFLGPASEHWASGLGPFGWFPYVLQLYGGDLGLSLCLAAAVTGASLTLALLGGLALARHPFPGARLVEEILMLPLALPGLAMAVALLSLYGAWRGSLGLLAAGHLAYALPLVLRVLGRRLSDRRLVRQEAVARSLGANGWQCFAWVTLPVLARPLMVSSLVVFAVSLGEFNVSFLLCSPLTQTYPAALLAVFTSNSMPVASAAMVLFLATLLPFVLGLQFLDARAFVSQGA